MATFTRGFTGRGGFERDPRLPPGQYDAGQSWPVLTAEPTPHLDTDSWSFTVEGLVQRPTTWGWEEIRAVPTAKTIRLRLPRPSGHLAGQHYVVRLTAPDGYSTSRSFSVASAPDGSSEIEMTVERLPDDEVSTFLTDQLRPGDELDVRGPIGGWFVWPGDIPALLVGGGSGVVPLLSGLLHDLARVGRPQPQRSMRARVRATGRVLDLVTLRGETPRFRAADIGEPQLSCRRGLMQREASK